MSGPIPLEVENLSYGFREPVFRNANFQIASGEFVTIIVEPGPAKAAFIDCLYGNLKPNTGKVQFWGRENRGFQRETIQQKVGWVISKKEAHAPWIRVREYMLASSGLSKTWNRSVFQHLVKKLGLDLERRMSDLTSDEALKVRLIRALSPEPKLLLLDDITFGLSPELKTTVMDAIFERFEASDLAVVNICHSSKETAPYSDRVIVIAGQGRAPMVESSL